MAKAPPLAALFARLGRPVATDLIETALTHPSAASPARPDYQRLEFLGDRVLNLVIAEALFRLHPDEPEGSLHNRIKELVSKDACAEVAAEIEIGRHLRMHQSEVRSGGRRRTAALGDAMEAVIAAVYLDRGFDETRAMIESLWAARLVAPASGSAREPKNALQEWAAARGMPPPDYVEVARSGPQHALRFTIEARLADGRTARAEAGSKREAEKAAAAALLGELDHG